MSVFGTGPTRASLEVCDGPDIRVCAVAKVGNSPALVHEF